MIGLVNKFNDARIAEQIKAIAPKTTEIFK
jgi:hypothetical protein